MTVTHLSQDEAKRAAIEAGREALREEGRAQWRPYVADAVSAAVKEAIAPLKDQFDANITELRAFHASHTKAVGAHKFWRGFAVGGVLIAAIACGSAYGAWRDAQLVNAAGRAIEQRGGPDVAPLTICDPAVERCLPDTVTRDSGVARPGREPASAR